MVDMNVVYVSDDNYAFLAGISLISLLENNSGHQNISIYILSDYISDDNKEKLLEIGSRYHCKIHIIDITDTLAALSQKGVSGYAAVNDNLTVYAKLVIGQILPHLDRVIYLDCDTLILGDIEELEKVDLGDKPIGLAYDCLQNRYKQFIGIDEKQPYYNAGVMLIDISKWNALKCKERIFEHITQVRSQYPLVEQDLINVVLNDDIYPIDGRYNYLSQYFLYDYQGMKKVYELEDGCFYSEEAFRASKEAIILHFCGQTFARPWYSNSKHPKKDIFDKFYHLSPWASDEMKRLDWKLPYKMQYILWKYFPERFSIFFGKLMQRIFIFITYKV